MRKMYWHRLILVSFILSVLSTSFLVIITIFNHKQNKTVSVIDDTPTDCTYSTENSSTSFPTQLSTVPSQYLVVPYREFALRTSIACSVFKFDNPKENRAHFHPKYSKYLRGSFPYIVPNENITFNDVENFYSKALIDKQNYNFTTKTSFAKNITFENIPYTFQDGMWHPIGVTSAQRTAILIPLQGREYNAKTFLLNIHAFVRRQQLTYTIILVEQVNPPDNYFNKGRLFNTAIRYLQKQSLNITCLILHDVDLIPEDDRNLYTCESAHAKHTTSRVRLHNGKRGYIRFYEFLIGGVLLLTFDIYKKLNGFSNLYWGWGGEDDDLALRFIERRMCVVRPSYELAIYVGLPHPRGKRNMARFDLLTWSTIRIDTDGFAQIESLTRIVDIRQTSTVTRLMVNVDADGSLNKSLSTEKPSLLNTTRAQVIAKKRIIKTRIKRIKKT